MSELVNYSLNEKVATITISNGKVNALSSAVFTALNAALDQAEKDNAVVVLTGQPGMLSAGYDLKEMTSSPDSAASLVKTGSTFCHRMMSFPLPIVVACTGHAVAKGAFLCLSADIRIGAEGPFKIALNEVAIGMTMHHAGIEMARYRMTPAHFQRSVICAEMFDPQGAVHAGFLDRIVSAENVLVSAQAEAAKLAELNLRAHRQTKLKVREAYLALLAEAIEKDNVSLGLN